MGLKSYPPQQKLGLWEKVGALEEAARWDIFEHEVGGISPQRCWIYPASASGKLVPIFKVLLSNSCRNNCLYCAHRAGRDFPRYSFTPEELAHCFATLSLRGVTQGMFLSSAVEDAPNAIMEKMLKAAEIVREKQRFPGYIHLKIMPGASSEYTLKAAELADRLSVNLEAPSQEILSQISPRKKFQELFSQLEEAKQALSTRRARSVTTQLVVGFGESDQEMLALSQSLYRNLELSRCYFSTFSPVPDTPLSEKLPVPKLREVRLYQADFLLRRYGFEASELPFNEWGNLPSKLDPKLAWAFSHPELFPVEINRAEQEELLRVPGIGPHAARYILRMRKEKRIRSLEELKRCKVSTVRAAPFILLDGRRERGLQLELPLEIKSSSLR